MTSNSDDNVRRQSKSSLYKKIGYYSSLGLFGWEYASLALEKYANKKIIKPSLILTNTYNVAEVYFFRAGQLIGVVYNGTISYVENIYKFLSKLFGNMFHYISLFVNDISQTAINIYTPTKNLLKMPFVTFSGFYQKINELSPVNLKYIPITFGLLGTILFGTEYCALMYEQKKQKNDPQYTFKYKPSKLLGYCSHNLQTKFTNLGEYLGNIMVESYTFIKNLSVYVKQYIERFTKWIAKTFTNIYTSAHNICSPILSLIGSPLYTFIGYFGSFENAGLGIKYAYKSLGILSAMFLIYTTTKHSKIVKYMQL